MIETYAVELTRREVLRGSLATAGAFLVGFDRFAWPKPPQSSISDPFAGGKQLGTVPFTQEAVVPMETLLGGELDGRLYTNLSVLSPENRITPAEKFYIRTRASELLETQRPWRVRVGGLVVRSFDLSLEELRASAKPVGTHLMECAGNARSVHFGLMSVADWKGTPVSEVLESAKPKPEGSRVLISGFDTYANKSLSSVPGASWIFTREELKSSGAFLATEMNGSQLTKDHGAPLRLIVPNWYGCACIKWVNEITFTNENATATSQMEEYAARTMQTGVPQFAREYKPAVIDTAAMPIRIEKWLVEERIKYRVVGILWGGSRPVKTLEIRFNPEEDYVAVDGFAQSGNGAWSFWTHAWAPKQPGSYIIRLRFGDPGVVARRLEGGYYVRSVEITEI